MKKQRGLSGIYFRQMNPETKEFESICFEDMEPMEQAQILSQNDHEFVSNLAQELANALSRVGEEFAVEADTE